MAFWGLLTGMAKKALTSKVAGVSGSKALGAAFGKKIGASTVASKTIGGQIGQGLMNKAVNGVGINAPESGGNISLPNATNSQGILRPQSQGQRKYYGMQR